jgi:hypothetical protein
MFAPVRTRVWVQSAFVVYVQGPSIYELGVQAVAGQGVAGGHTRLVCGTTTVLQGVQALIRTPKIFPPIVSEGGFLGYWGFTQRISQV